MLQGVLWETNDSLLLNVRQAFVQEKSVIVEQSGSDIWDTFAENRNTLSSSWSSNYRN